MAAPDSDIEWDDEVQWDKAPTPQPSMATDALPAPPTERKIGEPTEREKRWGQVVSFLSGSPLFGTVSRAAGALPPVDLPILGQVTGGGESRGIRAAQQATEQFSPKVAGVPVLPVAGGMVATAPAGAARVGGTLGGIALNTPRASMLARIGLQGGIGAVEAADKGQSVGVGTAAGLAGGAAGEGAAAGLGALARRAGPALRGFAEEQALKALLGGGTIVNRVKTQLGIGSEAQAKALGRDVLDAKLLGGALGPRTTVGINEANKRALAESGGVIGEGIETWDRLAADEAAKAAAAGLPSWTRPDTSAARAAFERGATQAAQRTGTAAQTLPEVLPMGSALEEPNVNTMRRLWDTKTQLGNQAFPPNTPRITEKSQMMRAGQQQAARNIEAQLEGRIGPDQMDDVRAAMKRYSLGKRIEGVVEDAATRDMAKSGPGFKDYQAAETLGLTGAPGFMAAMGSKLIRGRGNATLALGADAASRYAGGALGMAGAAARLGVPEAARQTLADPLGPLRQYLGMTPEERKAEASDAFTNGDVP